MRAMMCDLRQTASGLYDLFYVLPDGTVCRENDITIERAMEILKEVGAGDIE